MTIPRRDRIDRFVPAEAAIFEAQQRIEALPPNVRLTRAGELLSQARALVADFVDGIDLPVTARDLEALAPLPRRCDCPETAGKVDHADGCPHTLFEACYRDVRDGRLHPFRAIAQVGTRAELVARCEAFDAQTRDVTGKTVPVVLRRYHG